MDVFQQSPSQKIPGKNILLFKMKKYHVRAINVVFVFLLCLVIFLCHLSYDHGGVLLSTKKDIEQLTPPLLNSKRQPHGKEPNW